MNNTIRRALIGFTVGLAGLLPATAAQAATTTSKPTVIKPMANTCDLATQADPGSVYVTFYWDCIQCLKVASNENAIWSVDGYYYYCTYNPSNGHTDLHYDY
jgi:hypothetical protein